LEKKKKKERETTQLILVTSSSIARQGGIRGFLKLTREKPYSRPGEEEKSLFRGEKEEGERGRGDATPTP